ncbi:MAG: ABC transporter substrate-binding protein [Cryomorphaceae bacterium]|nr:MAG: ABC transporter substrate-binding protein [Cryomorphaceae bacterium]
MTFLANRGGFFLMVALLAHSACNTVQDHTSRMIFRYNEGAGISSLDPAFSRSLENIWAVHQLFNSLVELDSNMLVQPSVAESWEISEDGRVYTFRLRDDVFFHNHQLFPDGKGRKVTAHDFAYSFNRLRSPELASPGAWVLSWLADQPSGGVEVPEDRTLVLYLKAPFPPFLGMLSMKYCSVVPHEVADHYGADFRVHPVGTGPFQLQAWVEDTKLVMKRNEQYFERDERGQPLPYLDGVAVSFTRDAGAEFLELLKGGFDMISGLHSSYKDELLDPFGDLNAAYRKHLYLQKQPFLKTDYLGFLVDENLPAVKESPLRNKLVRQSLNLGIDRGLMVQHLRNNIYRPATSGFIPYGMPGFDPNRVKGYDRDLDRARALLREAGYSSGKELGTITLSTTSDYVDLCEFVQSQLEDLDVKIKVDVLPAGTHATYTAEGKLSFFRKSWLADYGDAENFLSVFYSPNHAPGGPNYTRFSNKLFDEWYEQSMEIQSLEERLALYQRMDSLMMEEAPILPLYYDVVVRFVRKNVQGLRSNAMNLLDLRRVRVLEEES